MSLGHVSSRLNPHFAKSGLGCEGGWTAELVSAEISYGRGYTPKAKYRINEAVRNNPDKFPPDYMFVLTADESKALRSKISSLEQGGKGRYSKYNYKAFTEKGLYMLATVLKSRRATEATFAIIETFAKVRCLKRELVELHTEADKQKRMERMRECLGIDPLKLCGIY